MEEADYIKDLVSKLETCNSKDEILYEIIEIGRNRGFKTFQTRKIVWPILLEIEQLPNADDQSWAEKTLNENEIDYIQLQKDAERSLSTLKSFESATRFHLLKRQETVLKLLNSFFASHRDLKYIQGFHDVASVVLMMFANSPSFRILEKLASTYFQDFLTTDLGVMGQSLSNVILNTLIRIDPTFRQIFACYFESQFLMFALSWLLTWFSHVLASMQIVGRIWDYILCTGASGVIYLTIAIILISKNDLLQSNRDDLDESSIMIFYKEYISNVAANIEPYIHEAIRLQETYPINFEKFPAESVFRQPLLLPLTIHITLLVQKKAKKRTQKYIFAFTTISFIAVVSFFAWKNGWTFKKYFSLDNLEL